MRAHDLDAKARAAAVRPRLRSWQFDLGIDWTFDLHGFRTEWETEDGHCDPDQCAVRPCNRFLTTADTSLWLCSECLAMKDDDRLAAHAAEIAEDHAYVAAMDEDPDVDHDTFGNLILMPRPSIDDAVDRLRRLQS